MELDTLKLARDRITSNDPVRGKKTEKQLSAIEKARRREINKQVFRAEK